MGSDRTPTQLRNTDLVPGFVRWLGKGEKGRRREGGNGVSFRGIDVPQYRADAVDTPICKPRPQSLASRNCVPKVRQGESYSSPSAVLAIFPVDLVEWVRKILGSHVPSLVVFFARVREPPIKRHGTGTNKSGKSPAESDFTGFREVLLVPVRDARPPLSEETDHESVP